MTVNLELISGTPLGGILFYKKADLGVGFSLDAPGDLERAAGDEGTAPLLAGTLQLETGVSSRRLLFPFGYLPNERWETAALHPPAHPVNGCLGVMPGPELSRDIGIGLDDRREWPVYRDDDSDWICVGDPLAESSMHAEFCEGAICSMDAEGRVLAIWIHVVME